MPAKPKIPLEELSHQIDGLCNILDIYIKNRTHVEDGEFKEKIYRARAEIARHRLTSNPGHDHGEYESYQGTLKDAELDLNTAYNLAGLAFSGIAEVAKKDPNKTLEEVKGLLRGAKEKVDEASGSKAYKGHHQDH